MDTPHGGKGGEFKDGERKGMWMLVLVSIRGVRAPQK